MDEFKFQGYTMQVYSFEHVGLPIWYCDVFLKGRFIARLAAKTETRVVNKAKRKICH